MRDCFYGKTWIYWAQLLILGPLGGFSLIMGILFWTGTFTDVHGKARPEAGPPMTIIGLFLLLVALVAVFNIVKRISPILRCYREGLELRIIGMNSFGDLSEPIKHFIGIFIVLWGIISLRSFRVHRSFIPWSKFAGAEVTGIPMVYCLRLYIHDETSRSDPPIAELVWISQTDLSDAPHRIAELLNFFAGHPDYRNQLTSCRPQM